tara:strand:+ start:547 stop:843 length:297 start_codon:yes stop_codon:yes gene_type:complete
LNKEVVISEGSNERLQWKETLEEKDDLIIYTEWVMGDNLNINGDDDCDTYVKIKKENLNGYNFDKLLLVLRNFDQQMRLSRFTQFLKDKNIVYDLEAW